MNLFDAKGWPLGTPYDYEYRGRKQERARQTRRDRRFAWLTVMSPLVAGAITILVMMALGTLNGSVVEGMVLVLFLFGIAGLFCFLYRIEHRKYRQLCEAIGKQTGRPVPTQSGVIDGRG